MSKKQTDKTESLDAKQPEKASTRQWSVARVGRVIFLVAVVGAGLLAAIYVRNLAVTEAESNTEQSSAVSESEKMPQHVEGHETGELLPRSINRQDDPAGALPTSITLLDDQPQQQTKASPPVAPTPSVVDVTETLTKPTPAAQQQAQVTEAPPTQPKQPKQAATNIQAAQIAQATLKLAQQAEQQAQKQLRLLQKALQPYGVQTIPGVMAYLPAGEKPENIPTWWDQTLGYFVEIRQLDEQQVDWETILAEGQPQKLKDALAPYKNTSTWKEFTQRAQAYMTQRQALERLIPAEEANE